MKTRTIQLGRNLDLSLGQEMAINESKSGKLISYNPETGEAVIEMNETVYEIGGNKFNGQDQLNS